MDIQSMSRILEEFSRDFTVGDLDREFFSDFVIYNDIGLPLAQSVVYELANPTQAGQNVIKETWINLCNILEVDPNEEYEDLDDMFDMYDEEEDE